MAGHDAHAAEVARIADRVQEFAGTDRQPRVVQDSSHSVRSDNDDIIDISALDSVLHIDEDAQQAVVEPNVPMDRLVEETLQQGFIPPVVMEFPGITVGGGIQGGAGESSSFEYGCFHNCFDRYELVLGDGAVVTASPERNEDLFHGTACSYGSLGVLTRARMDLLPAHSHVDLTYHRVHSPAEAVAAMQEAVDGDADFVDAILFSRDLGAVMVGRRTDEPRGPVNRFWRARDDWFYLHAKKAVERGDGYRESIPVRDYLFRYDRGAFWMGERGFPSFLPFNREARTLLDPLFRTRAMFRLSNAGNLLSRNLVQDPCLPRTEAVPFMEWMDDRFDIYPLWLLPLRPDDEAFLSPAYNDELVIDVGAYGKPGDTDAWTATRIFERKVAEAGGRQTLYAHQYWPEDEFWQIYDRERHERLRERYSAVGTFPDVYTATHVAEPSQPSMEAFVREMLRPRGWL